MDSKHRSKLSIGQIKLLALVAKFRFVTVEIISKYRDKSKATIYERFAILEDQGYIQKRYEKRWKLLGRPAVYSLTGRGLRAVRDYNPSFITEAVLRNQYKNRSASLQLVDHSLDLAKLCLLFHKQYEECDVFSKSEINRFESFLRPLSDIYIRTNQEDEEGLAMHYLLEVVETGTFTWMIRKRVHAHQEWFEEENAEGWDFEDNYPNLLFVCDNKSTEKRIHRLASGGASDFEVWTVTRERLATGKKEVWIQYYEEDDQEYCAL